MTEGVPATERFSALLDEHRRIVFKVVNTYCRHRDDRADLMQEILGELWRAFPSYDSSRPFSTWMYRVALNVAISSVRRRRHRDRLTVPLDEERHDTIDESNPDPDGDERIRALYRFIDQLDELNRALVLLYLEQSMELDELKIAWQSLDRRIDQQNRLAWANLRERKLEKARLGLRPLYWGQLLQCVFGIPVVLLGVATWSRNLDVTSLLIAGLIVHVYGVLVIALGGRTLWLINQIDYAAPVVAIQKQLAELRRFYVLSGMITGLPWWFLWMPFMMALVGLAGVDLFSRAPMVVYSWTAIGLAGVLVTWWFHHWSRRPGRPRLARFMEDAVMGKSLQRAQGVLDDVVRFEREDAR